MIDSDTGSAPGASPLGTLDGMRPLREHAGFIAVFILSAMLSALALTYIYSERYQAAATIFFKPSDITVLGKHGQEAFGSALPVATQKNVTQTITKLATSDVVLGRVVTDLHLDAPKPRDVSGPWYRHYYKVLKYELEDFADTVWKLLKYGTLIEDPGAGAMYKLYKAIKITNDDSYVYTLAVSSDSLASAIEQSQKLIDVLTELLGRDDRLSFEHRTAELVRLREQKSGEIEELNSAVQSLFASSRVAAIDDELKMLTDQLSKLRKERTDTQADLDQSEGKLAATSDKLRMIGAPNDGNTLPIARTGRISPEDYGKLTTKKLDAEIDSRGLRARLAAIDRAYNDLVPRIRVLTEVKAQEDLLAAKLTSAKRDYGALTDGIQELTIRQAAAQSELHVQARPNGAMQPVSPIKIYHVAAAAALAALVAIGLAFVLDYFQIRLFLPPAGGRGRGPPPRGGAAADR
jgi:uncharacterized protein involved in exopolysaccharide biosynthesis